MHMVFGISSGLYVGCGAAAVALALFGAPRAAAGQAADEPPPDKSSFNLLNPTPRALMREMSTDRPDTTESAYTVDAGHFQMEMSLVDFTYDRRNEDSRTLRAVAVAPMILKIGLFNNTDLQLGIDPYSREKSTDRAAGTSETIEGFGDTLFRLKMNLWGNDGGPTALAIMPFIKLPTAGDDVGNGHVEGGITAPVAIALPNDFSLGAMAELDLIRNADNDGYTADFVHTVTLGRGLIGDLDGYIEYAGLLSLGGDEDYRGFL